MEFRILGPVEVRAGEESLPLGGAKQRTVLAVLLLAKGQVVRDSRLSHLLWRDTPPTTASAQIYTYISRLRKMLTDDVTIVRHRQGYALTIGQATFDYDDFRRLSELGRAELAEGRYREASGHLSRALDLWNGPALTDVTDYLLDEELAGLEEIRMATLESRIETDLALGRYAELVSELLKLVGQYPLRESFRAHLMFALHRCGRQADALSVYHEGRRMLADELGVDPDVALRETYQGILTGRPSLSSTVHGVEMPRPRREFALVGAGARQYREHRDVTLPS